MVSNLIWFGLISFRMPNAEIADTKYKKWDQNLRISRHIIRTIRHDGIYGYNAIILER